MQNNKKYVYTFIYLSLFILSLNLALAQKKDDIKAIRAMQGCYQVSFEFAETFSPDTSYQFHDNYKTSALEWVELVENEKNKIVLQHLLIVKDKSGKEFVMKHWRQDWLYQNTELYMFEKNRKWKFVKLPKRAVKGQWTQRVFQVDDSPRYEGSATWIHADGKHYWEQSTYSPPPRRERKRSNEYNVMRRGNRHEITNYGWLHEQDNEKINRQATGDQLIVREKGWNTYTKVADTQCRLAQEWWKDNRNFWSLVRKEWNSIFAKQTDLVLKKTVDKKPLFMHLFTLSNKETNKAKQIIKKFVVTQK